MEEFLVRFGMTRADRTSSALYMRGTDPAHHIHITEKGDPKFLSFAYYAESEDDLERDFPEYELGAAPPAPGLLNVPGFVDPMVRSREWIVFAAGSHTDSVRMKTADLIGLSGFTDADLVKAGEE